MICIEPDGFVLVLSPGVWHCFSVKTTVGSDKSVKIPDELFEALGLHEGAELDLALQGGDLIAHPVAPSREIAHRIRERARRWNIPSGRLDKATDEEHRLELENERREGRL